MSGSARPLETEWALLRAACSPLAPNEKAERIRALLNAEIRWNTVFELAERHAVQPLLAQALTDFEHRVPTPAFATLKAAYQANVRRTLLLSREFIRIMDCLSSAGIEVMPYKGLALAEMIYGDIALRQSGDIDLLIHPEDLKRVLQTLKPLGYVPQENLSENEEAAYLRSGYECVFDGSAGKNLLEVQWAILPRFYVVDVDMQAMFQRGTDVVIAGITAKSPALEDLYLLLSVHAAKHVWERLMWLCDLARMSFLAEINWQTIADQAQELRIVRILRVTLLLIDRLLHVPVPRGIEETLPKDSGAKEITEEIEWQLSLQQSYDVESANYFRLMMRLRERRSDRLRFLIRLALTPGPSEWRVLHLPKPLFPLYRLVRVTRLLARGARARI